MPLSVSVPHLEPMSMELLTTTGPATTLFDESINVCNHADQVSCGSTNGPKSKSCFNALYGNTLHLSLENYIKNKTEHIYYWFRLVNKLHRLTELAL